SVLHVFEQLAEEGFDVTYLDVDEEGLISLEQLKSAMSDETILVSIVFVNNKIDTVQPLYDMDEIVSHSNAIFNVEAVQAIWQLDIDFHELDIDAMSITAHKYGEPKGVGVLLIKSGTNIKFPQFAGEQEVKRRAGTENVPQIVGLAEALKLA